MDRKDLDSPCREFSNGGLESVTTLLVCWQIDYSCASTGKAIQLYIQIMSVRYNIFKKRVLLEANFGLVQGWLSYSKHHNPETQLSWTEQKMKNHCHSNHHIGSQNSLLGSCHSYDVMTTLARQMICQCQNNGLSACHTHSPCVK